MAGNLADAIDLVTPGSLGDELAAFDRTLRTQNASENTRRVYGTAVRDFGRWLMSEGRPTDVEAIGREHVEAWIGVLLDTRKATTAHNRWRALQRFFNWYATKVEDFKSPMRTLKPPKLPKREPRILTLDEVRGVLGTCRGSAFEDVRDEAIIRLLFDSGLRRAEIANLRYSPTDPAERDLDLRNGIVTVRYSKGNKENHRVGISDKTTEALEDYLRARRRHPHAELPFLWLGRKGRLTDSGIAQMLEDRGLRVGLAKLHAHDFRHTATHYERARGMSDSDVMTKRGWESPAMLKVYASTLATQRAIDATKKLGLGDEL